ncbi:hypothetical protein HXX76_013247 [Chlamydomonas incerta]|uniref:Guanylate cyclase domain-containing protein n=1 Tax=Chlamydomonas incerta TaxID=51695 RepID=A0A835VR29_CHLIN|nr:hypothetical protein HXX76_013247 [Chlamydomonas incerta]|eukprot:KAG2426057.1 hypothetical protein HXX76_013247 [Chlamydomonas incerta]
MGRVVSVPLDGSSGCMLSRTDVLTHMGISEPPQSWTELLDFIAFYRSFSAAAQSNATGGGAGAAGAVELPPYPLCLPVGVACKHLFNFNAVWTTIAQTRGVEQGVHFNVSAKLEPLIDSPAAAEAFRVMAVLLAAAAPPEPGETCTHGALGFARGRCALVIAGMAPQLKYFTDPDARATVRQSDIRLSSLPGSEVVWQRDAGESSQAPASPGGLVPCTTGLCPYASSVTCGTPYCNRTRLINFAPAALLWTLTAGINSKAPLLAQLLAFEVLSYVASPDRYAPGEPVSPVMAVAPVRDRFTDVGPDNANIYSRAGYDLGLMDSGLALARAGSRNHPNKAWPLRMAGATLYNSVIQDLLSDVRAGGITLGGPPVSATPYFTAAAAASGWGSGASGTAPAGGWRRSSAWAASLVASGSSGGGGSASGGGADDMTTDEDGNTAEASVGDADKQQQEAAAAAAAEQAIGLEAALAAARNTLAAHYRPEAYVAKYLTSLGRSDLSVASGATQPAGAARGVDAPASQLQVIVSVSLASVFVFMVAALLLAFQLRRSPYGALAACRAGCKRAAADGSCCGRRLSFALGGSGGSAAGFLEAAAGSFVQAAKYAPEPHQPAVIVVTDIESSTQLWEELPAEVVAAGMHLHHAAVRRLLLRHEGYESATEGDSFITVFRSAHRAVMFGADLQMELVRLPWPRQLLEHPVCKPVYTLLPELYPFKRSKAARATARTTAQQQPQSTVQCPAGAAAGGEPARAQQQALQAAHLPPGSGRQQADGASSGARSPALPSAAAAAAAAAADALVFGLMTSSLCDDEAVTAAQLASQAATWCDSTLGGLTAAAVPAALGGGGSTGGSTGGSQHGGRQQPLPQSGSFKLVSKRSYCPGQEPPFQQLGRQQPASVFPKQQSSPRPGLSGAADGSRAGGADGGSAESNAVAAGAAQHPQCASAPAASQRQVSTAVAQIIRAAATAVGYAEPHSFMLEGESQDEGSGYGPRTLGSTGAPPALGSGPDAAYGPSAAPPHGGVLPKPGAQQQPLPPQQQQQQQQRSSLRRQHLASRLVQFFRRDHAAPEPAPASAAARPAAAARNTRNSPTRAAAGLAAGVATVGSPAASALARRNPSHLQLYRFNTTSSNSSLGRGSSPYTTPAARWVAAAALPLAGGAVDDDLFEVSLALAPVAEVVPSSTDGGSQERPAAAAAGRMLAAAAGAGVWAAAHQDLFPQDSGRVLERASAANRRPQRPPPAALISSNVDAAGACFDEDEESMQTMAFLAAGEDSRPPSMGSLPLAAGPSPLSSSRCASGSPATAAAPPAVVAVMAPPPSPQPGAGLQQQQQQQHTLLPSPVTPAATAVQRLAEYFSARREADLHHQHQQQGRVAPPQLAAAGGGAAAAKRHTTLLFRGLRVRVGMWAVPSLSPAELRHNAAAARLVVGGPSLAAAKALADMAHGGQVLLAGAAEGVLQAELRYLKLKFATGSGGIALLHLGTYSDLGRHQADAAAAQSAVLPPPGETALADLALDVELQLPQLQLQRLRLRSVQGQAEAAAAAAGTPVRAQQQRLQHEMLYGGGAAGADDAARRRGTTDVLCVVPAALSARLVHTPPLRVPATLGRVSELHDAPTAAVSYLVVQVPKLAALMAWDAEAASESLRLFRDTARRLLAAAPVRGYQVPAAREDQLHVAFPSTAAVAALGFAEALRLALLDAPWPQALLEHELGERVEVSACSAAPAAAPQALRMPASAAAAAAAATAVGFADAALLLHIPDPSTPLPQPQPPISAALARLAVSQTPPAAAPAVASGGGSGSARCGAGGVSRRSSSGWNLLRFFPTSAGGAAAGGGDAAAEDSDDPGLGVASVPATPAAAAASHHVTSSAFTTPRKAERWKPAIFRGGSSPIAIAQPEVAQYRTAAGMLQHARPATATSSQRLQQVMRPLQLPPRASADVPSRLRLAYGSAAAIEGGVGATPVGALMAAASNSDQQLVGLAPVRERPALEEQRPAAAFASQLTAELGLLDDDNGRPHTAAGGVSPRPESWASMGVLLGSSPPGTQMHLAPHSLLSAARGSSRSGGADLGSGCEGTSSGGMSWQQQQQQLHAFAAAVEPASGCAPLTGPASNGSHGRAAIAASGAADSGLDSVRFAAYYASPPLGSAAGPPLLAPAAAVEPLTAAAAAGSLRLGGYPGASDSDSNPQPQGDSLRYGWSSGVAAAAGGWPSATTATATPPVSHRGGAAATERRHQSQLSQQLYRQQHRQPRQSQMVLMRGLRIRMGLATGAAEWRISRSTQALVYTGSAVAAASKLASVAACGQLLCDRATHMLASRAAGCGSASLPPPLGSAAAGLAPAVAAALCNALPAALVFCPVERSAAPLTARKALSGAQLCSFAPSPVLPALGALAAAVFGASGLHSAPVAGTDMLRASALLPFQPFVASLPYSKAPAVASAFAAPAFNSATMAPSSPARLPLGGEYALGACAPPGRAFTRTQSSSLASAPANALNARDGAGGRYGHGPARKQPGRQSQELRRSFSQLTDPALASDAMGTAADLDAVVAAVAAAAAGPYGGGGSGGGPNGVQASGPLDAPAVMPATPRPRSQIVMTTTLAEAPHLRAPPPAAAAMEIEFQQQAPPRTAASPSVLPSPQSLRAPSRLRLLTTACGTVHSADVSGSRAQQQQASGAHHTASSTASNTASNTASGMATLIVTTATSHSYSRMPLTDTTATTTTAEPLTGGSTQANTPPHRLLSGYQSRTSFDLGPSTSRGEAEAPAPAALAADQPPPFAVVLAASGTASSAGQISSACAPPYLASSSGLFMFAHATTTASNWGATSTNARLASLPELPERGASAYQHEEPCLASFVTDAAGIDRAVAEAAGAAAEALAGDRATAAGGSPLPPPAGGGSPPANLSSGSSTPSPNLLPLLQSPTQTASMASSSHEGALPLRAGSRPLLRSSASAPYECVAAAHALAGGGAAPADAAAAAGLLPRAAAATLTGSSASGAPGLLVSSQGTVVVGAGPVPVASARLRRLSSVRYQGGFDLLATSANSSGTAPGMRRDGSGAGTSGEVPSLRRAVHTAGGADSGSDARAPFSADAAAGGAPAAAAAAAAASLRLPSFLRGSLGPHLGPHQYGEGCASPLRGHSSSRARLDAMAGAAAPAAAAAGAAGLAPAAAPHGLLRADSYVAEGAAGANRDQQQQQPQAQQEHAGLWSPFDASVIPCSPFVPDLPAAAAESAAARPRTKESSLAFWAAGSSASGAGGRSVSRLGVIEAGSLLLLPLRSGSHNERPTQQRPACQQSQVCGDSLH